MEESHQTISVGGLKILPSEIERIALMSKDLKNCKAYGKANPITGQHVEIICEPKILIKILRNWSLH